MRQPSDRPRPVPAVALLLAWLLPGAGHLYLGRTAIAVAGGAAVVALFAAGLAASDGRVFELLDPELRSSIALALTPEAGCLGALLWIKLQHGFGIVPPSPPLPLPAGIHLGVLLTALGGLLNIALMVDAHTRARAPDALPHVAPPSAMLVAGWLVPGLAHWLQGRRARAVVVGVLVMGLFALGTSMAEGSNLSRERHFYYWAAQLLSGAPAVVAELVSGHPPFTRALALGDEGLLFVSLAGLFNAVLLIDVFSWQDARARGRDPLARDGGRVEPATAAQPAPLPSAPLPATPLPPATTGPQA